MGIKYNEAKGHWEAYWSIRHPITRQPKSKRLVASCEKEAKKLEKEIRRQLELQLLEQEVPAWAALVARYLEAKRNSDWHEKTHNNCKFMLEAHTFEYWKSRRIDWITTAEIKEIIQQRLSNRSASTRQTLLKFIRGAFQYAVECGYLNRNPSPNIKFRVGDKIKKVLTEEQAGLLLIKAKTLESPWYFHWTLALYTGMRNGELFALTWDKVDLDNRTLLVDCSWNSVDGFKSTKSGDDRIVELAPTLVTVLKELKLTQHDTNFVLPRSRDWEKGEQARQLRMFLQGIGLHPVRFHDLRASWATIMLSKGIEPIKVMNMGGWKSLKTMQIYIRKAGVNIKGITDGLDLHDPTLQSGKVLQIATSRSNL